MPSAASASARSIEHQIGMLERYEVVDGGWAYYDFNAHTQRPSGSTMSFVTAAVLVALHEAEAGRHRAARAAGQAGHGLDPPAAQARLLLHLRRVLEIPADDAGEPPRRQPGPLAGLQLCHAAVGRQRRRPTR